MTALQKQCLLCAMGCLTPEGIDGIWGPVSGAATGKLQKKLGIPEDGDFGQQTLEAVVKALAEGLPEEETGSFWQEIRYFNREEFRCKCGGRYCARSG